MIKKPQTYLSDVGLSSAQRQLRMNIRNAYLAESVRTLRLAAVARAIDGKWFEACCLLELASED